MKYDEIHIENLEFFANHGVFPEETKLGQKFIVSLTLYNDTRRAGIAMNWNIRWTMVQSATLSQILCTPIRIS